MTRINVGIEPAELCDQHLIAEYRELLRAFGYEGRTLAGPFRLGRGHVIWCSQYPGTLADRYRGLVQEMRYRGFAVSYPEPRGDGVQAAPELVLAARPVVMSRIVERLTGMARPPRWTRRDRPKWARGPAVRVT